MNKITTRVLLSAAALIAAFSAVPSAHATIVFRDTFDRANSATFGPNSGPEGSGTWSKTITPLVTPAGAAGTFNIVSNMAVPTHNNDDALYQITQNTSAFLAPYPTSGKL